MLVACPSCARTYRHAAATPSRGALARCAGCHEEFELKPLRRAYVLVAAGPLPPPQPLQAPALELAFEPPVAAPPIEHLEPPVAFDPPVTVEPPAPPRFDIDMPNPEAARGIPDLAAVDEAPTRFEVPEPQAAEVPLAPPPTFYEERTAPAQPAEELPVALESPPVRPRRPRAWVESLVPLVPCALGGVLTYHLAGPWGQDPVTWSALGAAMGLLVGWACLIWITRRH